MDKIMNVKMRQRYDTAANWTKNNVILLAGEMGIESDTNKFKFGNGTSTWAELDYAGITADDHLNSEQIYFMSDLIFTKSFGKYSPDSSGSVTIPSTGKNLKEILLDAYSEEKQPSVTNPSITISAPNNKAYEVGTVVTPTYSISFKAGSYTYGPSTGITATGYSVAFNGTTLTTASGEFDAVTVLDTTNLKITATATYGDGTVPKTNLGQNVASLQIKAGTTSAVSSSSITGYRNSFYGTFTSKDALDSAKIRGLSGKSNKSLANGVTLAISVPVGALRVVLAYPATLRDVTKISDRNGMGAVITGSFTKTVVSVSDAGGNNPIDYKVYTLDFANANDKANNFDVTI